MKTNEFQYTLPNPTLNLYVPGQLSDEANLKGMPLRHSERRNSSRIWKFQVSVPLALRIPLLLAGLCGALGVLAWINPRAAQFFGRIRWPGLGLSLILFGTALLVLLDFLAGRIMEMSARKKVRKTGKGPLRTWRDR